VYNYDKFWWQGWRNKEDNIFFTAINDSHKEISALYTTTADVHDKYFPAVEHMIQSFKANLNSSEKSLDKSSGSSSSSNPFIWYG
jgi:hypothetical protein